MMTAPVARRLLRLEVDMPSGYAGPCRGAMDGSGSPRRELIMRLPLGPAQDHGKGNIGRGYSRCPGALT